MGFGIWSYASHTDRQTDRQMWIHNIKSNEGRCKGGEGRGERLMGNKRDHDTDLTRCIRHGGKHKVSRYLDGG